jgi:aldehyde dehydrogenase
VNPPGRRQIPNIFFKDVAAADDEFLDKAVEGLVLYAFAGGYYCQPTVLLGHNEMRVFQEEIFGPVLAVTTFSDYDEAIAIANDTLYGLGAGVWSRDYDLAYRAGRAIKAGRVWTNCYHQYPAGAAFGGYKISGIGRETHKMMLDHYSQTKNLLVDYSTKPLGFF